MSIWGGGRAKRSQLDLRHFQAAQVLAEGKTVVEAAQAAGVTERTVYEWQKLDEFDRMVKDCLQSLQARVRLEAEGVSILSKKVRLEHFQELSDMLRVRMAGAEKVGEFTALSDARVKVLQAVSKEIGEEGQSLVGEDSTTKKAFVVNLNLKGVMQEEGAHADA